jgi:transcriptional antiterminator Rof (Rho-off)
MKRADIVRTHREIVRDVYLHLLKESPGCRMAYAAHLAMDSGDALVAEARTRRRVRSEIRAVEAASENEMELRRQRRVSQARDLVEDRRETLGLPRERSTFGGGDE